jgi:hypothetical protein
MFAPVRRRRAVGKEDRTDQFVTAANIISTFVFFLYRITLLMCQFTVWEFSFPLSNSKSIARSDTSFLEADNRKFSTCVLKNSPPRNELMMKIDFAAFPLQNSYHRKSVWEQIYLATSSSNSTRRG